MKSLSKFLALAPATAIAFLSLSCHKSDPVPPKVTDIDGNIYTTITINKQVWMVENLKTTKYRNGDPIAKVDDAAAWTKLSTGAYCDLNNDAINSITYGRLYNWYAVKDSRNIAPVGWHVPSDAEISLLTSFLGGEAIAGGKLKEAGASHWQTPNTAGTNESGFTFLPGGLRSNLGLFTNLGINGNLWSTIESDATLGFMRYLYYNDGTVVRGGWPKGNGFSVRCVKD